MDYTLKFNLAPGDVWCLTGLLHDFADQVPQDSLAVICGSSEIFGNSPFFRKPVQGALERVFAFDEVKRERMRYGSYDKTDNMAEAMYRFCRREFGVNIQRRIMAPEFFPTEKERDFSPFDPRRKVCLVNSGYKFDVPCKHWGYQNFQKVVDALKDKIDFVQVGVQRYETDFHVPLRGARCLLDQTTIRDLAVMVYHADYILTGISQLHHAAGIQCYKPRTCITVAGAREPENWANCYSRPGVQWHWIKRNQDFRFCCEDPASMHDDAGCWRSSCTFPGSQPCMDAIHPDEIISIFEETLK